MKKLKSEAWYEAMRNKKPSNQFIKARELGLPPPEVKESTKKKLRESAGKQTHTDETKKKISEARIKYLRENPDKVPYKMNHYTKGRSYAEEYWKIILDSNNLTYEEQYQIGPYQLDFAFLNIKVDLEIDGDQHKLDKRIVESDKRRTQYLEDLGWKTIRVSWSEYKKTEDKKTFISEILERIHS